MIQIAICALARERSLWDKYNNGDNLLVRRRDFLDPQSSPLIADLRALGDPEITEKLEFILNACARRRKAPGKKPVTPRAATPAAWLSDYVEDYPATPKSGSSRLSSQPGGAPKSAKGSTAPADGTGFLRSLLRSLFGS